MSVTDNIGTRMKGYEQVAKYGLIHRMPVAIRVDGRAFHTFTRKMQKPFDDVLIKSMQDTMKYLCENIQGCVLGYCQSDEITLILVDYKELNTSAWFDNEVQKICSVSASMATMEFNKAFEKNSKLWIVRNVPRGPVISNGKDAYYILKDRYKQAVNKGAMFDSRCFNIPKEEVTNLIYWRQLDAIRNSIQSVGQANFSHSELQGKTCDIIKQMLLSEKNINWDNLPTTYRRGSCCVRNLHHTPFQNKLITTIKDNNLPLKAWIIDNEIPIFKNKGRQYIEQLVGV